VYVNTTESPDQQVATLVLRLHQLASEIESAHRYGIPIPMVVSVNAYPAPMGASFAATSEEFEAWADYCIGAEVTEYDHDGKHWWRATADVNGLPLEFAAAEVLIVELDEVSA
jgi:hypothetical protein